MPLHIVYYLLLSTIQEASALFKERPDTPRYKWLTYPTAEDVHNAKIENRPYPVPNGVTGDIACQIVQIDWARVTTNREKHFYGGRKLSDPLIYAVNTKLASEAVAQELLRDYYDTPTADGVSPRPINPGLTAFLGCEDTRVSKEYAAELGFPAGLRNTGVEGETFWLPQEDTDLEVELID